MRSDDNGGGGGLFAYYPTTGGLIRDSADDIATHTGDLGMLRRQLDGEHRQALALVDGDLYEPVSHAPEIATANLTRLEQTACFAAGVLRLFADAVDDYNHHATGPRSVDTLNAAYSDARLANFGLDADAYAKGGEKVDRDYDTDRTAAEADLLATLTIEYQRLGEWLDLRADQIARMLDHGPNPGDVTALWAAGALPPDAYEVWPHLDLAEVPLLRLPYELRDDPGDRLTLQQLSQDELLELWEKYEFEPARELLADQIVHDFENMTALREFNLSINLAYMAAMSQGMPEWFARKLAKANPDTIVDLFAPIATAGNLTYRMTVGDLVDAIRENPWSLRTLGEIAMVTPVGRLGKLHKVEELVDTADDARDAERLHGPATSAMDGVRLRARLAADEISNGHAYDKHIDEFRHMKISTRQDLARHVETIVNDPTEVRDLKNGRTAYWDAKSGTIVIRNPFDHDGGTTFIPKTGYDYFLKKIH